jgi:hypothetical protein
LRGASWAASTEVVELGARTELDGERELDYGMRNRRRGPSENPPIPKVVFGARCEEIGRR